MSDHLPNNAALVSKVSALNISPEKLKTNFNVLTQKLVIPLIGIAVFLFVWSIAAQNINTSLVNSRGQQR